VVVADGDNEFVEQLKAGLEADPRVAVVGAAKTTDELVDLVEVLTPDLVMIDWELHPKGASHAIRLMRRARPSTHTIVLVRDERLVDITDGHPGGAAGYIRKDAGADGLRESFFELASLVGVFSRRS
jgi:DNA-binding NarL/FixJ family response regulator